MKLGVSYIVFDGVELLEKSILQIRDHSDWISVIYQEKSWFGDKAPNSMLPTITSLLDRGIINEIVKFEDFTPRATKTLTDIRAVKEFERRKRQVGLRKSLDAGCTHYLCMDVDEFYVTSQFAQAKQLIIDNGYTATSAPFINYVNLPTIHRGYDGNRVPFICKISELSNMGPYFFVKCDPTRGISNCSDKTIDFNRDIITMHHMETVRKDLTLKYLSTTRGIFDRSRSPELVNRIKSVNSNTNLFDFSKIIFPGVSNSKLTHCENQFNIPYEDWK
jgi:hypothetical protein